MNRNFMNRNFVVVTAAIIIALGATAGCKRSTSIPTDTAPSFSETVADQTYTVGEAILELRLPAASGGNGELTYSLEPAVPGLSFDPATRTLSGTPTSAGSYGLEYRVEDGDDNTAASDGATLTFTVTVEEPAPPDTAPSFSETVADQTYTVGEAVLELRLPAASGGNGELTYSLEPAVPGLSFDPATRTLGGTPTSAGSYGLEYRVEDGDDNTAASDSDLLTFTITVEAPVPDTAPSFGDTVAVTDQDYTVGEAFSALILPAASGGNGELTYSLDPMVPGLTFEQTTRTLSGTPSMAGTFQMEYRVEDGDDNTDASDADLLTFTITVDAPAFPDTWEVVRRVERSAANDVAWSKSLSLFVAVGAAFLYSTDGENWSQASAAVPADLNAVAWSDSLSRFVAVGRDGLIMHSSDGKSWSEAASSGAWPSLWDSLSDVIWSESLSRFVAVGPGMIVYSADGDNWDLGLVGAGVVDVTWSKSLSRFVAVGSYYDRATETVIESVIYSADGDTWFSGILPPQGSLKGVTWSESLSLFVAVGGTVQDGSRTLGVFYSADGINWSTMTRLAATEDVVSIESLGYIVAVGYGVIASSSDGDRWNHVFLRQSVLLSGIAWSDSLSRFVAVGTDRTRPPPFDGVIFVSQ